MKKKTLLSLLTGIAIVASTAGTYAEWDKISDNSNDATVTFNKPVTVNFDSSNTLDFNVTDSLGNTNEPSAKTKNNVKFNVIDPNNKANTLQVTAKVTDPSLPTESQDVTDQYTVTVKDEVRPTSITQTANTTNGITETIDTTKGDNFSPSYSVTITPKDSGSKTTSLGKQLNVTLTAQLTNSSTAE